MKLKLFKDVFEEIKQLMKKDSQSAIDPAMIMMIAQIVIALMPVIIAMGKEIFPIIIKYIPQIIEAISKAKQPGVLDWEVGIREIAKKYMPNILKEYNEAQKNTGVNPV